MKYIILHKGVPHKGYYFESVEQARNWLKMNYPNRRFKESQRNILVCVNHGSKFEIITIVPPESIQQLSR